MAGNAQAGRERRKRGDRKFWRPLHKEQEAVGRRGQPRREEGGKEVEEEGGCAGRREAGIEGRWERGGEAGKAVGIRHDM